MSDPLNVHIAEQAFIRAAKRYAQERSDDTSDKMMAELECRGCCSIVEFIASYREWRAQCLTQ